MSANAGLGNCCDFIANVGLGDAAGVAAVLTGIPVLICYLRNFFSVSAY